MSVDLYIALPVANWPSAEQVQRCMVAQGYPIGIQRFPSADGKRVMTDGASVMIDGTASAYLEGEVFSSATAADDVATINGKMTGGLRIEPEDVVMSFRTRSPAEMRAASYMIAGLVICFDGFGFEPQGNTSGRRAFADSLIVGAELLKDAQ